MVREKEIIKKRGIIFKPDNTPDPKEFHPAVIILQNANNRNTVYYLTLTSNMLRFVSDAGERMTQYYRLLNKLPKPSLVNLDYIYKAENVNDMKMVTLDSNTYQQIIHDLRMRQEYLNSSSRGADEYYEEIRAYL